jgi:hypothetical protein
VASPQQCSVTGELPQYHSDRESPGTGTITSTVTSSSSSFTLCEDSGEKKEFLGRFFGSKERGRRGSSKRLLPKANSIGGIDLNIEDFRTPENCRAINFGFRGGHRWWQDARRRDSEHSAQLSYGLFRDTCSGMAFKRRDVSPLVSYGA